MCPQLRIGAESTPRHFASSMWKFGRPVVILGLMAIAVFAVGPQLGSVDADEDSYPEVPVVVASTSRAFDSSSATRRAPRRPQSIDNAVALRLMAVQPYQFGIDESEFPLHRGSAQQSFCVLRC
jgi:hypothetical protein